MIAIVVALIVLSIDLLTKTLAASGVVRAPWIEPVLNPDLALGVLGGPTTIEVIGAAVALGGAVVVLRRGARGPLATIALGLVVGASLGNLADRLAFGSVRDFLVGPHVVFNVADIALAVGLGVYAVAVVRRVRRPDHLGIDSAAATY